MIQDIVKKQREYFNKGTTLNYDFRLKSLKKLKNSIKTLKLKKKFSKKIEEIDAIAVTYAPGLLGSLLVGVECAKTLSLVYNKPLIAVNHTMGHIYANNIDFNDIIDCIEEMIKQSNYVVL